MDSYSDLRSASKDRKRNQDHKYKWAHGSRYPVPGYGKERPAPKCDSRGGWSVQTVPGLHCNLNKARNWHEYSSPSRAKAFLSTKEELEDPIFQDPSYSFLKDLPSRNGRPRWLLEEHSLGDPGDVPYRPIALDSYVKSTGRDTEQYVQQEFVVVDAKGESASGRRARHILRKAEKATGDGGGDDDGFELL
ncbi:hypothetical protein MKZ38_004050 [Zalerion maritima]|uniref:Uncharacterized protein n=1 Tax=Zalerion maritima TaxID=339359 RepID=A0AAD5RN03_9PEZI|nr:hypothetical protein MKZ38_004050 [Zalerion maritima]